MREIAVNRSIVDRLACATLIALAATLCPACSDPNANTSTDNASNQTDGIMQNNAIDNKLRLDTSAFQEHWGELQSFDAAVMKRNESAWREMVARGDTVFGVGVLFPSILEMQSIVITTENGIALASWVVYERPVTDYEARTFGMGQPGYGVARWYPIDLARSQTELQIYWSRHGAAQPALTIPSQDLDQLRGQFIEINLMEMNWRIVGWVLGSH